MSSSAQVHRTFCTFDEVVRPQIFSMQPSAVRWRMEPQNLDKRNCWRLCIMHAYPANGWPRCSDDPPCCACRISRGCDASRDRDGEFALRPNDDATLVCLGSLQCDD